MQRFFRTPKGLLLIILVILAALAAPSEGVGRVWPSVASSVAVAGLIDALILWKKMKAWEFPSGAVLTALFVAMVLSPLMPWYVAASSSAFAVISKYILRTRSTTYSTGVWRWSSRFMCFTPPRTGGGPCRRLLPSP